MKFIFLLAILFSLTSTNASGQTVEDDVMEELLISFKEDGLNLFGLVEEYEKLLIQSELLEDASVESWQQLIQTMCSQGRITHVASGDFEIIDLEFQLSLQPLSKAVSMAQIADSALFEASDIHAFINQYPQPAKVTENPLVYLWRTVNSASESFQKHPLYKHILVLIVANFADILDNSNDKMLQSESDYARWTRSMGGTLPTFEMRNVCGVRINSEGTIRIRSEIVDSTSELKPILKEFYSYNRNLSQEEAANKIQDRAYEGYNMPFFSHVTDAQINGNVTLINQQLDTLKNNDRLFKTLLWRRELWLRKKQFLYVNGGKSLKEIQSTAHIQLQSPLNDTDKLNDILVPILETFSELRNSEAKTVFGESFDVISKRNNFLMNDHFKLRYLENQFPLFILVNPQDRLGIPFIDEVEATPPPTEPIIKQD
jgi:hypothetical protein